MAWLSADWTYRVKVTTLADKVDADLTSYPVYVDLNNLPAGFHTNCNQTDARDIRVTKADGTTELAREVVFYDATTDTGELHFLADAVDGDTNTDFYIYYGNAGAADYAHTDPYGAHAVWTNYRAVYHLHSLTVDSGPNSYTLTASGSPAVTASGKVGKAVDFEYNNHDFLYITDGNCQNLEISGSQTWQCWAKVEAFSPVATMIMTKYEGGSGIRALYVQNNPQLVFNIDGTNAVHADAAVGAGNWVMLHGVFNNTTGKLRGYVNAHYTGAESNLTGGRTDTNAAFRIGADSRQPSYTMDGLVDEARISATALTDTWISTEYNNQNSPSTFYQVGSEETNATTTIKDIIGLGIIAFPR